MKKYELTSDSTKVGQHTLFRIKALKDFGNVKAGELGGFVQAESNLSQLGDCWVYDDARVRLQVESQVGSQVMSQIYRSLG